MKTQIITLFTALILVSGIAKSASATTPVKNETATVLTDIRAINKIEVYGNVELYVSDGTEDQVKVYNKYYSESALVQSKNGVLSISSYKKEKLVVWVTVNDLREVAAYDNAEVKSFGKLSKIEFNVELHNNATANLNLDAFSASVTVSDEAKANLIGTANEYALSCKCVENVDQKNFVAQHTSKTIKTIEVPAKTELDDLAIL